MFWFHNGVFITFLCIIIWIGWESSDFLILAIESPSSTGTFFSPSQTEAHYVAQVVLELADPEWWGYRWLSPHSSVEELILAVQWSIADPSNGSELLEPWESPQWGLWVYLSYSCKYCEQSTRQTPWSSQSPAWSIWVGPRRRIRHADKHIA